MSTTADSEVWEAPVAIRVLLKRNFTPPLMNDHPAQCLLSLLSKNHLGSLLTIHTPESRPSPAEPDPPRKPEAECLTSTPGDSSLSPSQPLGKSHNCWSVRLQYWSGMGWSTTPGIVLLRLHITANQNCVRALPVGMVTQTGWVSFRCLQTPGEGWIINQFWF